MSVEWCWICLQDDTRVVATKRVNKVALCAGCYDAYKDEPEVLAHVTTYYKNRPPDAIEPIERYGETEEPRPVHVKHLCLSGCGKEVPEGQTCCPGHEPKRLTSVPEPEEINPDQIGQSEEPEEAGPEWPAMIAMLSLIDTHTPQKVMLPDGGKANDLRLQLAQSKETKDWRWKVEKTEGQFVYVTKKANRGQISKGFSRAGKLPERPRVAKSHPYVPEVLSASQDENWEVFDKAKMKPGGNMAEDPLDKAGVDIEAAATRFAGGESMRKIAQTLKVPIWRFQQSPKWKAVKAGRKKPPEGDAQSVPSLVMVPPVPRVEGALDVAAGAPTAEPRENRIRFIMFDAVVSEGNLAQLTKAITDALGAKQA